MACPSCCPVCGLKCASLPNKTHIYSKNPNHYCVDDKGYVVHHWDKTKATLQ